MGSREDGEALQEPRPNATALQFVSNGEGDLRRLGVTQRCILGDGDDALLALLVGGDAEQRTTIAGGIEMLDQRPVDTTPAMEAEVAAFDGQVVEERDNRLRVGTLGRVQPEGGSVSENDVDDRQRGGCFHSEPCRAPRVTDSAGNPHPAWENPQSLRPVTAPQPRCGKAAVDLRANADGLRTRPSYLRGSNRDVEGGTEMKKLLEWGGVAAGIVLIVFGVVAISMGANGRSTVGNELKQQQIVGTPDMTPAGIKVEAQKAGLKNISYPTCSVANQAVNSGARARCFADYMRIHALEATGGYVYSQMGIYTAAPTAPKSQLMPGGGTDNANYALTDPKTKQPVQNGARNVWVTETALTTALNTSYMATQLALFGIVVGIALLLTGIGLLVLAAGGALRGRSAITRPHLRHREEVAV